jgi:hypothetical protein
MRTIPIGWNRARPAGALAGPVQIEGNRDPGRSQADGADSQLAANAHEGLASRADPVTQLERSSTMEIVMGSAATTNCSSAAAASAARVSDLSAGACDLQPAARPASV